MIAQSFFNGPLDYQKNHRTQAAQSASRGHAGCERREKLSKVSQSWRNERSGWLPVSEFSHSGEKSKLVSRFTNYERREYRVSRHNFDQ